MLQEAVAASQQKPHNGWLLEHLMVKQEQDVSRYNRRFTAAQNEEDSPGYLMDI